MTVHSLITVAAAVIFAITVVSFTTTVVNAAPTADEVTNLPLYGAPPSKHYSGYVYNDMGGWLHYYWVFPEDTDPATSPVIMWTNGGPGCSSMEGFAYELGPFQFFLKNVTTPKPGQPPFVRNKFTWAKRAHVVFIENPPGVGFSYVLNSNDMKTNDKKNAQSNFNALKHLFGDKFSEFKSNPFYVSGESYGGIYLPTLSDKLLDYEDNTTQQVSSRFCNFKGMLVGNGVTDATYDDNFAYSNALHGVGHGVFLQSKYNDIVRDCIPNGDSDACYKYWEDFTAANPQFNIYGMYSWCYNGNDTYPVTTSSSSSSSSSSSEIVKKLKIARVDSEMQVTSQYKKFRGHFNLRRRNEFTPAEDPSMSHEEREALLERYQRERVQQHQQTAASSSSQLRDAQQQSSSSSSIEAVQEVGGVGAPAPQQGSVYPLDHAGECDDEFYMDWYFNRLDVKQALHVETNLRSAVCFNLDYTKNVRSVVDVYNRMKSKSKVVVIYNGIADFVVPYTGTWSWIQHSTSWKVTHKYTGWTFKYDLRPEYGPQLGGFAMKFDDAVWFVAVSHNAATHMVPQSSPAAAYEMLSRVISGKFFPESTKLAAPQTFLANPVTPPQTSWSEAGKYIGVGIAICIGIAVVVVGVYIVVARKSPSSSRQAMAESAGAEYQKVDQSGSV